MSNLVFNYLMDLRKKEIDPKERALLISNYLKDRGISVRALGRETGISHNTLLDWLLWEDISVEEIRVLESNGLSKTDIYRHLRGNGKVVNVKLTKTDLILKEFHSVVRRHVKSPFVSEDTVGIILSIINDLNRMRMYIDKRK